MSRRVRAFASPVAAGVCTVLLISCGGGTSSSDSATLPGRAGRPDVPIPAGPPPTKLVVIDLKKGRGRPARNGDELSVRYFRFAYKGHRIYEDDWRKPTPSFALGGGQRTEAWEEGLSGIRAGGRRELVVPGGEATFAGAPEVYVVEAISVTPAKRSASIEPSGSVERVSPSGAKPSIAVPPGPAPTELVVRKLKEGSGGRIRRGERIGARFVDINYETRHVQDFWGDEREADAPYGFVLGEGDVRKGWEIALPGQRLGTRLELLLPSRLAYGDGAMRYVVELIEREKTSLGRER